MISPCQSLCVPRQLGIKLSLGKPLTEVTAVDVQVLKRALEVHGVISFPGSSLNPQQLKDFVQLWGEVLLLPPGLAFNSQIPSVPQVARVGNVLADGSIVKKHSAAEYWHHDGDFWSGEEHHILNFLYCVKTPTTGGNTGFLDTRKAYLDLSAQEKKSLLNAYIVVHGSDIEDFKTAPPEAQPADVKHPVLLPHPHTGQISLYLPESSTGIQAADGSVISKPKDFVAKIEEKYKMEYRWTEGDLLIWDNLTTMHRSMGGYLDSPRLLFRCQARLRVPTFSYAAQRMSPTASCRSKFLTYSPSARSAARAFSSYRILKKLQRNPIFAFCATLRGSKARALFPGRSVLRVFR